jgi:predicted transcriptional regulator
MSKRLQVELSDEDFERLRKLASGKSLSDLVRRALSTEEYLQAQENKNAKVLIEAEDGTLRELVRL